MDPRLERFINWTAVIEAAKALQVGAGEQNAVIDTEETDRGYAITCVLDDLIDALDRCDIDDINEAIKKW